MNKMKTESGFFDLQVNGFAGADFNGDDLDAELLGATCERLHNDGVAGILATVITDSLEAMSRRLARIVELRNADENVAAMIRGFHIEGPFLNEQPGYIGAHPVEHAQPANLDAMNRLLDAAGGLVRIVTLAPERDPDFAVTRSLSKAGVCVSAGHCDPDLDTLRAAIDAGLTMFTHLGNACPLMLHRHDNIIQRVLSLSEHLWIGLIADGVHVPFATLKNFIRLIGTDRCFVVSDAISAAGLGPGTFTLGNQTVVVDESLATWSEDRSHLMGSAGTMVRSAENLKQSLGFDSEVVDLLTSTNPQRAIRASGSLR